MASTTQITFIVHIWWEDESLRQRRWRGQVQHIPSGETFSFQEPNALWHFIEHWSGIPTREGAYPLQQTR